LAKDLLGLVALDKLPALSLYVHIPWCIKKCPYCDFNSHLGKVGSIPEFEYLNALFYDLEQALPLIWGRSVKSIFIGGGTPSVFSGEAINQLLGKIRSLVNLSPFAEVTMEINPGTLDVRYISDYKLAGVNRVSFGVQSFNDKHLKLLGRIHNADEAIEAISLTKQIFDNINIDIMYGLPEQKLNEAIDDVRIAIDLDPQHISCYNLTIEPNTAFYNNSPKNLPDNDECYNFQNAIVVQLDKAGYSRYEISAYAKNQKYALHNLNYWQYGDYLGIGAGAHSKISFSSKIIRQVRHKHPATYMKEVLKNQHIIEEVNVELKNIPFEFAMNTLRLINGIPIGLFVERTGLPLNSILPKLQLAQDKGFLILKEDRIQPTKLGLDFLNDLLMLFLED
jgi:oxygen-independent coproporphyrinogen-3 oxidase